MSESWAEFGRASSEFVFAGHGKRIVPSIECSTEDESVLFYNLDSGPEAWITSEATLNVGDWE